jgi:voltage-gated potassium channel
MIYLSIRFLRRLQRQKELGIALLLTVLLLSVIGNTLTFYYFDRDVEPKPSLSDGLWYSVVSITTIGYGDKSATTLPARLGTVFFIIIVGLATFTTAVGVAVNWIADLRQKERNGMGKSGSRDHLIIVNFPGESRIRHMIREYRQDKEHKNRDIIVIADQLQELPFSITGVSYIRGWPLEEETFQRANIDHARQAIILSPSNEDPRSDSLVASIAFVMNNLSPEINIIAECLDPKHAPLFNVSDRVTLVYTRELVNNLLVQEAQDSGVTLLTRAITSNEIDGTLASTTVGSALEPAMSYANVAKNLLDHDINLVGVVRDGAVKVSFQGLSIARGDGLVYVSKSRETWDALEGLLSL